MKYFKKIVGERIYLSPVNSEDIEKFTEWLNDFDTTDYLGRSSYLVTVEDEKKYFEKIENNKYQFFIVTLDEDKLIGTVSIESINLIDKTGTLGIFIGDKNYRSNGYGTEAIKLILDYGFNYLNLQNIGLSVLSVNERAFRCYQKCGFKEYGRRRNCKFINGKYYDAIYMDILKDEFTESFIKNKNV